MEPYFDTPTNVKKAAWEALKAGKTKYEPTAGDYELREEICKKLKQNNNSITGASLAGGKAMTATASGGYYMQEGICRSS